MDRRDFFLNSALASTGAAISLTGNEEAMHAENSEEKNTTISASVENTLLEIPIFCAHEHWGSVNAIGMTAEGFRADTLAGAEPLRKASVWDLVLDPYFGGWISAAGYDANGEAHRHGHDSMINWWQNKPLEALSSIESPLRAQHYTGAFQCIRQGIHLLHDVDIAAMQPAVWQQADDSIQKAYITLFSWYRHSMKTMNISELIRPVHPEFFLNSEAAADEERAFTHPILRIDPLLELWPSECPRRDRLAAGLGVEPRDADSWRNFITVLFDLAATKGNVGIKQLQAYTRSLDFVYRKDRDVTFSGTLNEKEKKVFQDWVVHECCKQAHERNWSHQVHTGTHNLEQSSPLPLASLANRYPNMKIVLLHCWPFLEESGFLAKHTPNIYLDTCWQTVLNPAYLEQALTQWLGYIPSTKIMCSQDATSVEMAAGSVAITRSILNQALIRCNTAWKLPKSSLYTYAADILNNNAVSVYNAGTTYSP